MVQTQPDILGRGADGVDGIRHTNGKSTKQRRGQWETGRWAMQGQLAVEVSRSSGGARAESSWQWGTTRHAATTRDSQSTCTVWTTDYVIVAYHMSSTHHCYRYRYQSCGVLSIPTSLTHLSRCQWELFDTFSSKFISIVLKHSALNTPLYL